MIKHTEDKISIKDLGLICSLYSMGLEAEDKHIEGNSVYYDFSKRDEVQGVIMLYNSGKLEVNARVFHDWHKLIIQDIKNFLQINNANDKKTSNRTGANK